MKPVNSMNSGGRTIEFFKIDNHMMFTEIRPVKCTYVIKNDQTELKTTKWMEVEHWRELENMMEQILKDYHESGYLYGTKKVQHNVYHDKIGESIKLGFIYQPYKSCGCHIVTPRDDISESDSEDDNSQSLKDKGGRFKKFRFCEDSLVVSVCPIIMANKITKYQLSEHSNSPQRMNIKLKKALKLHDSKDRSSLVSEYFISQNSNATVTKSQLGSKQPLSFRKNIRSKTLATNSYGNNKVVPKPISLFDTDVTSSDSFNSQKLPSSRVKKKFDEGNVKLEETSNMNCGMDEVESKKAYCNIGANNIHRLRRKKRASYEECDFDSEVECDESPNFSEKVKLNNCDTINENMKNEHVIDSDSSTSAKSGPLVKTKRNGRKIKVENDLKNHVLNSVLSGKLYPDKVNKKYNEKSLLNCDNNIISFNTTDSSYMEELTQGSQSKLSRSNRSKLTCKKPNNVQPTKPISKSKRARIISIFGSDSPSRLFEENDDEFLATGSPDNKFEGFNNDISLHSNHVKQTKKSKSDRLGHRSNSSKYYSNSVMPQAKINKKRKNKLDEDLDHCSLGSDKSIVKNSKRKYEIPQKVFSKDTSSYKKKYSLSVTPNKASKNLNCNDENVVSSDRSNLNNKNNCDNNQTNSRVALAENIQNKTKLSRKKRNIVKGLAVDQIMASQRKDCDDFIGSDSSTSKKTCSSKIIETMENDKTSLITKKKRGRSKKVVAKNKGRQSIDLFEDSASSNAASSDDGYSKYSMVMRNYVKRSDQINCNISDKSAVVKENSINSSEEESDDDVNYFKNYFNNSLPLKCSEVLAETNHSVSWKDDSYELPNLELTQVCSKASCNEELIPKPSNVSKDSDTDKYIAAKGTMTSESEEFLPSVTNYLSNLSLDDLLKELEKNLDYLWSIARQEIYTSRNKDFQTPNKRRQDPSYFMCLYDDQVYSKLGDVIVKEFGKYIFSEGHGDGSAYAYFVIIPELLKKLLTDWTEHHLSNEKFLTDEECENIFYEIAINAPDPPESYTYSF